MRRTLVSKNIKHERNTSNSSLTLLAGNSSNDSSKQQPTNDNEEISNYHSLQSLTMSASRESSLLSDDDDNEDEEEYEDVNPITRLRKLNNIVNSSRHLAAAATDTHNVSKHPSNASISPISIDDSKQQHSSDSSSSQQHQKALLSLLKDMRSLEQQMESQKQSYINEKATLTNTISQQAAYISELQQTNEELNQQNKILNKQLSTMLSKLDKFATGCWKFHSSSVKKMSSALHTQLREWNKLYQQQVVVNANTNDDKTSNSKNLTTTTCSQEEERAMELVTMEKLMNMELEIQELKRMNGDSKEKLSQRSDRKKKKKENKMEDGDESVFSGIEDTNGEDIHTQMTPTKLSTKVNAKKVQVSKDSPVRSILKQSSRYDHRLNKQRTVKVRLQHSPQHSLQCKPQLSNTANNSNDRAEYLESDMWAVSWGDEEKSEV